MSKDEQEAEMREKFFMILLGMLIFYSIIGLYMEHKKPPIGHETGVIVVLGMLISFYLKSRNTAAVEYLQFNNIVFFQVLLPLIIFASGYNMKRKKFFENIKNITKFGLVATILTFIIYSSLTVLLFKMFTFTKWIPKDNKYDGINWEMSATDCMLFCSILCSSDIIAAVTIIKYED
jgi:NhaP-type Na+/H+ or K+/H+ antiporter